MMNRKLSPPLQLSLMFLLFGVLWILLTDVAISAFSDDPSFIFYAQTFKGILFIIFTTVLIYFISRRLFNRQHQLIRELSDKELHYKNHLAQEVLNAQEAERKMLGEELHDNINQLLGVVKLYIEHAQVNHEAKDEMLQKSAQYITQVINEIRNLSRSLISPALSDIGLIEAIGEMVDSIHQAKQMQIGIEVDKEGFHEEILSGEKKTMLYRILQEQLNNVIRHAEAQHVDIRLRNSGSQVQLVIADDGVGFNTEARTQGLGLNNIRHRLELFNGKMNVESEPGKGCRLEAVFEA